MLEAQSSDPSKPQLVFLQNLLPRLASLGVDYLSAH